MLFSQNSVRRATRALGAAGIFAAATLLPANAGPAHHSRATVATSYATIYNFGVRAFDGIAPAADLLAYGGLLYGTTYIGGTADLGTVFAVSPTGLERVLHSFGSGTDGIYPEAPLVHLNNELYGTTSQGGTYYSSSPITFEPGGTLYAISTAGPESVIHSFGSKTVTKSGVVYDGRLPAGLVANSGLLYGLTGGSGPISGSETAVGTFYSMTPSGGEMILHTFSTAGQGSIPVGSLVLPGEPGYGVTAGGGAYYSGTVFSINRAGIEKVIHSFGSGTDGQTPFAGLTTLAGVLYGTTQSGGTYGAGTIFSMNVQTGVESVLHSFTCNGIDGCLPAADLTAVNGMLYGTTESGGPLVPGTNGYGTLFSYSPQTGKTTILHDFGSGYDGATPLSGLTYVGGIFYGATSSGGAADAGTVYRFSP